MLYPLRNWTVLRVAGRDAAQFLHNFCTADVKALPPGAGCEAFFTNVKARIVGHGCIYRDETATPEALQFTIIADPDHTTRLAAHLDRYLITEQVTVSETSVNSALWLATNSDAERLRTSPWPAHEHRAILRAWSGFGSSDLLIEAAGDQAAECERGLIDAGCLLSSPKDYELARIAALWPTYGVDISEEHLAPEADRPEAISYTKGCYLGQEPIARIYAMGHVNRQLRGLRLEEAIAVPPATPVLLSGVLVGAVSSSAADDTQTLALAMLRTRAAIDGTCVELALPDGTRPAIVYNRDQPEP